MIEARKPTNVTCAHALGFDEGEDPTVSKKEHRIWLKLDVSMDNFLGLGEDDDIAEALRGNGDEIADLIFETTRGRFVPAMIETQGCEIPLRDLRGDDIKSVDSKLDMKEFSAAVESGRFMVKMKLLTVLEVVIARPFDSLSLLNFIKEGYARDVMNIFMKHLQKEVLGAIEKVFVFQPVPQGSGGVKWEIVSYDMPRIM